MRIEKNKSLAAFNTFGFEQRAEYYVEAGTLKDVQEVVHYCKSEQMPLTVIGDGSNVVLVNDLPGMTLRMTSNNIEFDFNTNKADNIARVSADAGVNWHQLVRTCIKKGAHGLENLSLIPGTVGAAPIQNIGAYGVELSASVDQVECVNSQTNERTVFSNADCRFDYRDSLFKQMSQNPPPGAPLSMPAFIITRVEFNLQTAFKPRLSYAALATAVANKGIEKPDAQTVSDLVCEIRQSKLPDPAKLGNAGSFFKNPVVDAATRQRICETWNNVPVYPQANGDFKLAAGWMVEQAGFKGASNPSGHIGAHKDQALVLVNHGGGTGPELLDFADEIKRAVLAKFGVTLEQEPGILPRVEATGGKHA